MDLEYLGYEFHDDFASVGLISGGDTSSSATGESIVLVEILPDTLNKFIAAVYAFSKSKTINLDTQDDDTEGSAACIDNEAH